MALSITLVNQQSTKNVVHKSTCQLPVLHILVGQYEVENDEILMEFQLSYDEIESQHFVENDEILFNLQFKPLPEQTNL